jgi:hypothetical protein
VAAPPCRVLAGAVAPCRHPIKDALDPPAHSAGSLGLHRPYRLDCLHDESDIDGLHGQSAEYRVDIGTERRGPLRGVLVVTPAGLVRGDVVLGARRESHRLGSVELDLHALSFARLDRVAAVESRPAAVLRLLACLGEADGMGRAKPHLPQPAGILEAEDPGFRTAGAHLQEQPAAIAVVAAALDLRDGQRRQLSNRSRHCAASVIPVLLPILIRRIVADGGRHKTESRTFAVFIVWVCTATDRKLAEREGFEPSVPRKEDNGFRDRPVRPLRHLSMRAGAGT